MRPAAWPEERVRRCPVHAEPDADVLHAWACPDDCPDFLDELERRIENMKINGNYVSMTFRGVGRKRCYKRYFANHKPVTRWILWEWADKPRTRRMHAMYRAKKSGW